MGGAGSIRIGGGLSENNGGYVVVPEVYTTTGRSSEPPTSRSLPQSTERLRRGLGRPPRFLARPPNFD